MRIDIVEPERFPVPPSTFGTCSVEAVTADRTYYVTVRGEIDLVTGPDLLAALAALAASRPEAVVLDLGAVTFLDCAGVAQLVEAAKALARIDSRLTTRGATGRVRHVLELCDVVQLLYGPGDVGDTGVTAGPP